MCEESELSSVMVAAATDPDPVHRRGKTSLDYLIENEALYQSSQEYAPKRNPYITAFVRSGLARRLTELAGEDRAVHKLVNHKKLRKEITESYGALVLLEKCARRLTPPPPSTQQQEEEQKKEGEDPLLSFSALHRLANTAPLVFLDVCSGKGITSFLLALLFPAASVVMLDANSRINRDHLLHPACRRVTFEHMDINSAAFPVFLQTISTTTTTTLPDTDNTDNTDRNQSRANSVVAPPPLCLVLGTHLCGHLSTRLAAVFSR
jgi:hypothetical protein